MRVPAALLALFVLVPATATGAPRPEGKQAPAASSAPNCPRTTSYLADKIGVYRGQRMMPKKLTELPPATTYMAVYRHIGACEVPLTMVEYRNPRRR